MGRELPKSEPRNNVRLTYFSDRIRIVLFGLMPTIDCVLPSGLFTRELLDLRGRRGHDHLGRGFQCFERHDLDAEFSSQRTKGFFDLRAVV